MGLRFPLLSVLALLALSGSGCTRTVQVRVQGPHTAVTVAGVSLGEVPEQGEDVPIPPGMDPVPYEIRNGDDVTVGSLARTEPLWWIVAVGLGGALCCAPTLATAGFCVANPAVLGAPLAFAAAGDVGALSASCVSPSWFTLPTVAGCGTLGLSPLALAFAAESLPDQVVLTQPPVSAPTAGMGF